MKPAILLTALYRAMRERHGHRGWWPVFRAGAGPDERPVYDPRRKRLTRRQRFEVAVGAILTQNTAWTNVERAMIELHRARVLSRDGIRRIPLRRLAKLIRSSGYFNQKAKKLKAFVRFLDGLGGPPGSMPYPPTLRGLFLSIHGVGPETADSILLYALGHPVFVVDAYTRRIFSRHGWIRGDEPYDEVREMFERGLPRRAALWNDYHAQLVEIGKRHCHRRRPDCLSCPLYRRGFFESSADFNRVMS